MKVQSYRRMTPNDFPDAPEWFHRATEVLNKAIEDCINAVSGGQSINENTNCEIRIIRFTYDTEATISLNELNGSPVAVSIINTEVYGYPQLKWELVDESTIRVTVKWDGGSAGDLQDVTLRIEGP